MIYEVYTRNKLTGKRDKYVDGIMNIEVTFRRNQPAKWSITGAGLEECPLANGADIVIFRDNAVLLCGYVENIQDKYNASNRIYDWKATGQSDLGKLSYRLVYPDPADATPDPDGTYSATGYFVKELLTVINKNAGGESLTPRQINHLDISEILEIGEEITIESKFDQLDELITDKLADTDWQIREIWDLAAGSWTVKIQKAVDVSGKIIFSVDNGSISAWQRTIKAPKANWLLVTGCQKPIDESDPEGESETMSCIVYDQGSIDKWGRIETLVIRSDITRIVEKDDEGTVTYEEPWTSVAERLESAAYEELEKASAEFGYKLTTAEISRNVYGTDYDIGSIVAVRIANTEFTAPVKEIKITYTKGIEKIVPSVGTMQKGELESVFTEIGTLKDQIRILQQS